VFIKSWLGLHNGFELIMTCITMLDWLGLKRGLNYVFEKEDLN
jgi:hypothetical protein